MPGMERAPGGHRSGRGRSRQGTALTWAKWGSILVLASLASFFVSLYWIAPRVHPSRGMADAGSGLPADGETPGGSRAGEPARPGSEASGLRVREPQPEPSARPSSEANPEPHAGDKSRTPAASAAGDAVGADAQGGATVRPAPDSAVPAAMAPAVGESSDVAAVPGGDPAAAGTPAAPVAAADAANQPSTGDAALFRVEVGAPATRADAERLASDLRKQGFPSHVIAEGSIVHVQAGAFRSRRNAEALATSLGNKGYAATIAGGPAE